MSAAPVAALVLFTAIACTPSADTGPVRVELNTASDRATIDVLGLSRDALRALDGERSRDEWTAVLRVAVAADQPPIVGETRVVDGRLRFTPMFPLDPGRQYHVTFDDSSIARAGSSGRPEGRPYSTVVALPARNQTPTTTVAQVFPSSGVVPENQLRLYLHFSAPMGRRGGLDYIHLLDEEGKEVKDPFLPLDAEFWNDDRTRYTVFFDPGRQKRGIPVIDEMGRSLTEGNSYTLVVDQEWRDGNGLPLKQAFRRTFKVGPPDERPLDARAWTIAAPRSGTSEPLAVVFPEPLDHGLLLRALGVTGPDGNPIGGDVLVGERELSWRFTPKAPWQAGAHHLVALGMLEDLSGNRIGRAFEVDNFDRSDRTAEPERTTIRFDIK